jgi:hypothetical protein
MRWRHVGIYVVVAGSLAAADLATRRAAAPPPSTPAAPQAQAGLDITEVLVESSGRRVRVARDGARWQVAEPADAALPTDLIDALIAAVLNTPAESVTADRDRLAEFGLAAPPTRITFARRGGAPVTLALGARNPAETGIYGRLEGSDQVVLIGLNAEYYVQLVVRNAFGVPTSGEERD